MVPPTHGALLNTLLFQDAFFFRTSSRDFLFPSFFRHTRNPGRYGWMKDERGRGEVLDDNSTAGQARGSGAEEWGQ